MGGGSEHRERMINIDWFDCLFSETSDKYLKAINRLNMISFFISFLAAADQCPTRVVVAAGKYIYLFIYCLRICLHKWWYLHDVFFLKKGQCLTTLTEDNKDIFIEFKNHPEYVNMLFDILNKFNTPDKVLVRVLACGKKKKQ